MFQPAATHKAPAKLGCGSYPVEGVTVLFSLSPATGQWRACRRPVWEKAARCRTAPHHRAVIGTERHAVMGAFSSPMFATGRPVMVKCDCYRTREKT
jgi:hypothetical protein